MGVSYYTDVFLFTIKVGIVMAKLITTEQIAKLLENEYDAPLDTTVYIPNVGVASIKLEYVADSLTFEEKGKKVNMPMNVFETYYKDMRWIVNSIADLSQTEINMAVDYIISQEKQTNGEASNAGRS